ncbi:hypothetical protein B0H16DRAFT_1510574 [Mycena metata]|uniref:BTB domain-containing protein n=1 Tax=Mycena metata TaxID=1033252 RepID=A0AAD7NTK5_9AGAR|nr:hypothetical protein B0H16DRAFT_1510574 [Mycena metata]
MATKRRRAESWDDSPTSPVRSDIWFEDGNIIVQAEDTQFRVYKGPLCKSSEVLKTAVDNMGDSKGVDGCPLLFLSDSPTDLGHVFRALFDPWSNPDSVPLPFEVVAAFLRLGRKYDMKPMYSRALARVTSVFPTSVEEFTACVPTKLFVFADPPNAQRLEIVVDTILLARELTLPSLLPSALWYASVNLEAFANRRATSLSEIDRQGIILGGNGARSAYAEYLFDWLDESAVPSPNCIAPKSCCARKMKYSLKLWRPPGSKVRLSWHASAEKGLCTPCITLGKKHHSEGRKRFWKELPSFFNLPSWDELLALAVE